MWLFVCVFDRLSKNSNVVFTLDATGLNDHIHLFTVFYGNKKCAHEYTNRHIQNILHDTRPSVSLLI